MKAPTRRQLEAERRPCSGSRRSMVGGALASTLVVAALVGSTAMALTKTSDTESLASDETKTATATCGAGKTAISGGFQNPGFDALSTTDPAIWTFVSRRNDPTDVIATGHNDGDVSGDLIAYAYCSGRGGLFTRSSDPKPLSFGDKVSATARCPSGSSLLSGGFEMSPATSFPLLPLGSSRARGQRWKASGTEFGGSSTITAFAYCRNGGADLAKAADSTRLGHDKAGSATAKCARGTEVVSGGFFAPGGFSTSSGSEIYFYESRRVGDRRWKAAGLNQGDPARLVAYAYCK